MSASALASSRSQRRATPLEGRERLTSLEQPSKKSVVIIAASTAGAGGVLAGVVDEGEIEFVLNRFNDALRPVPRGQLVVDECVTRKVRCW